MLQIKLKLYCDVLWFDEIMCMFHEENARFIIFNDHLVIYGYVFLAMNSCYSFITTSLISICFNQLKIRFTTSNLTHNCDVAKLQIYHYAIVFTYLSLRNSIRYAWIEQQ